MNMITPNLCLIWFVDGRNSSSLGILEVKDKINLHALNYVTCVGTQREEVWVGGTSKLYFVG